MISAMYCPQIPSHGWQGLGGTIVVRRLPRSISQQSRHGGRHSSLSWDVLFPASNKGLQVRGSPGATWGGFPTSLEKRQQLLG